MSLESLESYVLVVKPDGRQYRWDGGGDAMNIPSNLSHGSKRNTGFDTMQVTLPRPLAIDFPDLDLFDDIYVKALSGDSRWEGRIVGVNRTTSTEGSFIQVDAVGWMAHMQDQKQRMLYVDRDLNNWLEGPGSARRAALYAVNQPGVAPEAASDTSNPGVVLSISFPQANPWWPLTEAWYVHDTDISAVYYDWKLSSAGGLYYLAVGIADDDVATGQSSTSNLAGISTTGSGYFTDTGRVALIQYFYGGPPAPVGTLAGAEGQIETATMRKLAVYGVHGLTRQGADPGGYIASDVLKHMVSAYCPRLNVDGVQSTGLPIPHLFWDEPTTVYDAALKLNGYHLWELAVWEDHTLHWGPLDLTDWDWEVRTDDPGVEINLQGDSAADLVNAAIVHYDQLPGREKMTLEPSDDPQLRNDDPYNVINAHHIGYRPVEISPSFPMTRDVAITVGAAALAEAQQPKRPGTIKVAGGYIRDRQGNLQPASKVRATDRVRITDIPGDVIRPIGEASWDQDNLTLTIGVDSTIERLEAFYNRVDVGLQAANLT